MQWVGQQTAGSTTNLYVRKGDIAFRSGVTTNNGGGTELVAAGRITGYLDELGLIAGPGTALWRRANLR